MPRQKTTSPDPENVLTRIKASGLIDDSTSIVKKAALILEDEVAKGIIAAKEIQKKFTGADGLKDENKNQLIERFRKDVHDIADSLVDILTVAVSTVEKMVSQIGTEQPGKSPENSPDTNAKSARKNIRK